MDMTAGKMCHQLSERRFDSGFVALSLGDRFERLKQELRNLPIALATSPCECLGDVVFQIVPPTHSYAAYPEDKTASLYLHIRRRSSPSKLA
jgi:hypothetical protein